MTTGEMRDLLQRIANADSYVVMPGGGVAYVNRHREIALAGLAQLRREAGEMG